MHFHDSKSPQQALAFFTHIYNSQIERRYRKLTIELGERVHPFILAEVGTPIPKNRLGETHFFDFNRLRSGVNTFGDRVIPGNEHLVALDFYRNYPGFEYYWFIEYDVVFSGNWAVLLDAVRNDSSDLLAGHIRSLPEEPKWVWWDSLNIPDGALPRSSWLRAFCPVYRISRQGLKAVEDCVRAGWTGHFEALIPTAIRSASLSISDIGGDGARTPGERRHRFYSSRSFNAGASHRAGTLRHRPTHAFRLRRNAIFHPVKPSSWTSQDKTLNVSSVQGALLRCLVSSHYNLLCLWSLFDRKLSKLARVVSQKRI